MLIIAKVPSGGLGSEWRYAPINEQPRPVILDPTGRAPLKNMLAKRSKYQLPPPWIFCRDDIPRKLSEHYVPVKDYDRKFKWEDILSTLAAQGVNRVMIEGGGSVINDVLSHRVADVIVISISPVFLGKDGVGVLPVLNEPEWLEDVHSIQVENDWIVVGRMKSGELAQKLKVNIT